MNDRMFVEIYKGNNALKNQNNNKMSKGAMKGLDHLIDIEPIRPLYRVHTIGSF